MERANFWIDREMFAKPLPESKSPVTEVTGQHELVMKDPKSFLVLADYALSVKGNPDSEVVNISCKLSALFTLDVEADPDSLKRFAEVEAKLVFWPYFRHFVADSTYRMSINPLYLPLTSEMESAGAGPSTPSETTATGE
jgi:preprotein translocase subunit SecB